MAIAGRVSKGGNAVRPRMDRWRESCASHRSGCSTGVRAEIDGKGQPLEGNVELIGDLAQPSLPVSARALDCADEFPDVGPARKPCSPPGGAIAVDDAGKPPHLEALVEKSGDQRCPGRACASRLLVEPPEEVRRQAERGR